MNKYINIICAIYKNTLYNYICVVEKFPKVISSVTRISSV